LPVAVTTALLASAAALWLLTRKPRT
jgi:hypothetical protein